MGTLVSCMWTVQPVRRPRISIETDQEVGIKIGSS